MDSWEALLDHGLKFCKDVQVLEKFKEKETKVEMLLPNYTKGSGMSCWR